MPNHEILLRGGPTFEKNDDESSTCSLHPLVVFYLHLILFCVNPYHNINIKRKK